jgi:hypothetical protein
MQATRTLWNAFSEMNSVTLDRGDLEAELCQLQKAAALGEQEVRQAKQRVW